MSNFWILTTAFAGYLLGSLPFGYLVAKAHGVDIFKVGSGNPGATNVKRVLGAKAGNTVLVLDMIKGAAATAWPLLPFVQTDHKLVLQLIGVVAAVIGHAFSVFTRFKGAAATAWPLLPFVDTDHKLVLQLIGVVAAVIGHAFSVFTRFKGGKSVATAAGGLLVLIPGACLLGGATWVATFYAWRYVSLASILAAAAVIAASWLLPYHLAVAIIATVLATFVILRHHENIRRLLNGTESRFVKKSAAADAKKAPPQS